MANVMEGLLSGKVISPCKELCSLAMYGIMSKHLSKCKLWPLPKTENYNFTPFQLYTSMIRVICNSSSAHKPMRQLHIGSCSFTGAWKLELQLEAKTVVCKCDVHWGEGETDRSKFQEFMDHAAEELSNFDCPNNSLGPLQDNFGKEILELCPMESFR
ncbi:hypothetical protein EAF00_006506 [Botryotinia globosa]|nr:hypothetical protein EAF00_006506 [Botryotinia globosa]